LTGAVQIRRIEAEDLDRVLEIEQSSFGRDAWNRRLFLAYLRNRPELFLVAVRRRTVVGYAITVVRSKQAELESIAVDPRNRGSGIARGLASQTRLELRRRGVRNWWLMVDVENELAIRFYTRYGFERVRRSKGYYGAGRDAWRMRYAIEEEA